MTAPAEDGLEIPVWVNGSEKLMTGLTKRTTCDDVIYSLLSHEGYSDAEIAMSNHVIYERLRKSERPLQGKAKLVKVWRAAGTDCHNVRFIIRRIQPSAAAMIRSRRSRGQYKRRQKTLADDFWDPEKARAEKSRMQTIEDLVHLVREQQRRIQDQDDRLQETDGEIDNFETKIHLSRVEAKGQNYVLDAYLQSLSDDSSGREDGIPNIRASDLEMYLQICDNILQLEERISLETSHIDDLSFQIQEQSQLESPGSSNISSQKSDYDHWDSESIRRELKLTNDDHRISVSVGELQRKELDQVNQSIAECELELQRKNDIAVYLERELETLSRLCGHYDDGVIPQEILSYARPHVMDFRNIPRDQYVYSVQYTDRPSPAYIQKDVTAAYLDRSPTQTTDKVNYYDNDSNSDTGLSSLHSDESPPVLETLV